MLVTFLDDEGNIYDWAPKWPDVEQVFLKQINVERFNKPQSAWLNKFARTQQQVVEGAQRIESAHKIQGWFGRYEGQKLLIDGNVVTPGFEITVDFLDKWLGRYVEAFIINDVAIRLRELCPDGTGEYEILTEYPPCEDEIPF
jgi:hypothetical protein